MRVIGLLGGTSWPSTIEYYKILNKMVQSKLGGFHSANLLLRSIDYHGIKSRYHDGWDEIPLLLGEALKDLDLRGPDCIVICNNTLHKAYDLIKPNLNLKAPVINIVETVGRAAFSNGFKRLLLLGTKFTMEDGFYANHLKRFGCDVIVPKPHERDEIQKIQTKLAFGHMEESYRDYFKNLLACYTDVDAVILGCTELPLAIKSDDASTPLLNPIKLQCKEALEFAFKSN